MLTGTLVFLVGVCLLGWHRSHEEARRLKRQRNILIAQRSAESALDRLWRDIQAAPPLDIVPDLHLVDPEDAA